MRGGGEGNIQGGAYIQGGISGGAYNRMYFLSLQVDGPITRRVYKQGLKQYLMVVELKAYQ